MVTCACAYQYLYSSIKVVAIATVVKVEKPTYPQLLRLIDQTKVAPRPPRFRMRMYIDIQKSLLKAIYLRFKRLSHVWWTTMPL